MSITTKSPEPTRCPLKLPVGFVFFVCFLGIGSAYVAQAGPGPHSLLVVLLERYLGVQDCATMPREVF